MVRYIYLVLIYSLVLVYQQSQAQTKSDTHLRFTSSFAGSTADQLPFWLHSGQNGRFGQSKSAFGWIGFSGGQSGNIGNEFHLATGVEGFLRQELQTHPVLNQWWVELRRRQVRLYAGAKPEIRGNVYNRLTSGSMGRSHNAAPVPAIGLDVGYTRVPFTRGLVEARGHIAHGWLEEERYTSSPYLHEKSFYLRFGNGLPVRMQAGLVHFAQYGGHTGKYGQNPAGFSDFMRIFFAKGGEEVSEAPGEWYALGNHIGIWDLRFDIDLKSFEILLYRQWIIETGKELLFNTPQDGLLGLGIQRAEDGTLIDGILWEFLYTKYQNGPHPASKIPGKSGQKNYYNNVLYQSGWTYYGRTIGNPLLFPSRDESLILDGRRIANSRVVAHHIGLEGTILNRLSYQTMFTYSRNYGTYQNRNIAEKKGIDYLFEGGAEQFSFFFNIEAVLPVTKQPVLSASVGVDWGEVHPVNTGLMLGISWDIF